MSGRALLGSSRSFSALPFFAIVACFAQLLRVAPALAQSAADPAQAPSAPAEPSAPPPEPAAPAPSEAAPPGESPPPSEPAPTPAPAAAPSPENTTPPAASAAPKSEPPASAAFAALPAATREIAKPAPMEPTPPSSAAPVAPPIAHAASDDSSKDDDSGGLLGPFRIGVLVGTGLPEVANFGGQIKLTRFFGAGINVGLIPTVKIKYYGEAAQKYQEYDAYGHIYPFGGSFFLGAGVGYAQIDGTLVNHINLSQLQAGIPGSVDVTSDATVRTLVLTPQIGFLKIFDVGFAVGFDIGAQIPIAPSEVKFNTVAVGIPPAFENEVRTKYINPNDEKVRSTLNTLGRTPLPTFNFKIGWFL